MKCIIPKTEKAIMSLKSTFQSQSFMTSSRKSKRCLEEENQILREKLTNYIELENEKLKEDSSFNPISPYAEGKLMVHKKIETIKNDYGWLISSGIMFNHESEFRDTNYLFMKIIKSAIDIKYNKKSTLTIGSLDLVRDWSFAGDFADAIHLICLEGNGEDFVIGSGVGHSISELVRIVFEYFDLDPKEFIEIDSNNLRPGDPLKIVSDPVKIKEKLNWETKLGFEDLILRCISKGNF